MQPQTSAPVPVNMPPMGAPQPQMTQPPQIPNMNTPPAPKAARSLSRYVFVALFAIVGGLTTYLIFAQSKSDVQYFWMSSRYQETFWDGQVHTNPIECANNGFICHNNGTLVFSGGQNRVWQSDPKKNNPTKLASATWHGPYGYSPGPYKDFGFGISGNQQACFLMKDVGSGTARITLRVQNQPIGSINSQNLITLEGNLSKDFKRKFLPVCVSYYNPNYAYAQQYMVYVKKGTVQIDYVDNLIEYFTYDYNPYPYDYFSKSINANAPGASKSKQSTAICSAKLSKSTSSCLSSSELSDAAANNRLTDVQLNPANQD